MRVVGSYTGGALLFAAGLVVGALGVNEVSRLGGERPEAEIPPSIAGVHAVRRETRPLLPEGMPMLDVAGVDLDPDNEQLQEPDEPVISIGPPMDADLEFFIPAKSGSEEVVRIGEPRDVDALP